MSEDSVHALLSASGAHRWATCPASLRLERDLPNTSSKYAEEGTLAHDLAARSLLGEEVAFPDAAMKTAVAAYVNLVRQYAEGGELLVEQRVSYHDWLGLAPDLAFGTSDTVILHDDRLTVIDLKYGMGVKVDAEDNEQLMLYALGALYEYEMLGDFQTVTMVICQPRLGHVSEWEVDVTALKTFALNMRAAATRALKAYKASEISDLEGLYQPEEKACRFCRAKASCPALLAEVEAETRDLFAGVMVDSEVPEDRLATAMSKIDMLEGYCKAVRAEVERRLLAGQPVQGYKLVQGRRGARAWSDADQAEAMLKSFRLRQEDMYSFSLLSPTVMEKTLKEKFPRRWTKLEGLVTQSDGKPSVAPESDKRSALQVSLVTDSFAALASAEDMV